MLITPEELAARLGEQGVVVFDCRFQLGQPNAGREAYMQAHIPGAYYLDLEQDLSAQQGPHTGRHPLPDLHELARRFGAAGVGDRTIVIVYDGGEGMAMRAWWLLRYLGHDRVSVLDGGWKAWLTNRMPTSADIGTPHRQEFHVRLQSDFVVRIDEVESHVANAGQSILLDARAAERFRGETEPLDPRAGHIPGALSAPWTDNLTPDGRWKNTDELRAQFEEIMKKGGYDKNTPIIAYCGSGVTACANLFALELAGIRGARLYAGSWSEWCSYPDHRAETGSSKAMW